MQKTKIDWADSTWNPVTGCRHDCEYCYARRIARRFEGVWDGDYNIRITCMQSDSPKVVSGYEFDGLGYKYRVGNDNRGEPKLINAPYPYGFHPTLHRHRLETGLARYKRPRTIFVCSMADLFGEWVPDEWIEQVFEACKKWPQHRYLFLTKNPLRYYDLIKEGILLHEKNYWYGATVPNNDESYFCGKGYRSYNDFISMEPLQGNFEFDSGVTHYTDWVIIGAETGNRKGIITPKREWIENIINYCRERNVPVFMKSSLRDIWDKPLIQEYPWRTV